jgi:hypothetical protein
MLPRELACHVLGREPLLEFGDPVSFGEHLIG